MTTQEVPISSKPLTSTPMPILTIEERKILVKVYEEMRDEHPKDSFAYEALDYRLKEHAMKISEQLITEQ